MPAIVYVPDIAYFAHLVPIYQHIFAASVWQSAALTLTTGAAAAAAAAATSSTQP